MIGLFNDPFFSDPFYFWDPSGSRRKELRREQERQRLREQRARDLRRLREYEDARMMYMDYDDSDSDDEYERQLESILETHRKHKEERRARKAKLEAALAREREERAKASEKGNEKENASGAEPDMNETPGNISVRTRSTISRLNGVEHVMKEVYDGRTGERQVIETKRIGDKSITVHRHTDKSGNVSERETRENVDDDDVSSFHESWSKLTGSPSSSTESLKHESNGEESKCCPQTEVKE